MSMDGQTRTRRRLCQRLWFGWVKLTTRFNRTIESLFESHARFVTVHHRTVIFASIVFALLMAAGGLWIVPLQRHEELFLPQNSQAFMDLEKVDGLFHEKYRVEEVILKRKDQGNIINDSSIFQTALDIHEHIINLKDFRTSCLKVDSTMCNSTCLFLNPLEVFDYSKQNFENISKPLNKWLQNPNLVFSNGRPATTNYINILGNYATNPNGSEIKYANAIRMVYYMIYADTTDEIYDTIVGFEKSAVDLLEELKDIYKKKNIQLSYLIARTRDDAMIESIIDDLPLLGVAFSLMIGFCVLVFIRIKNPVTGHFTTGVFGVIVVVLGIICGFGMAMWLRIKFIGLNGAVVFLILGIGMDNIFIMIHAMESVDPMIKGDERLVIAMKHVGASITMTTTINCVAFATSTVSAFPAIHLFCIYASLSIFFAYVMLITLFLALLTWDIHRIERGQRDFCPCTSPISKEELGNPWKQIGYDFSKKVIIVWGEILMMIPVKIGVVLFACGLLAAGTYGSIKFAHQANWKKVDQDDSSVLDYIQQRDSSFPPGYTVSVILPQTIDYTDDTTLNEIIALDKVAINTPGYENKTINWVKAYKYWAHANKRSIEGNDFYIHLDHFLNSSRIYKTDIKFHKDRQSIKASRVVFFYQDSDNSEKQFEAMKTIRKELNDKMNIKGALATSIMFIYTEMFEAISNGLMYNLIVCAVAVLLVSTPYLVHPGITGLVFLTFVSLIFELTGLMAAWGISLDGITTISILMAIGFSVDYTCHIAHAYIMSTKESPEERLVDALSTMGTSVFNGGTSTFLGILITAFARAKVIRTFFKMIFGIVVLGLLHGLVLLPVFLSILIRRDVLLDRAGEDVIQNPTKKTTELGEKDSPYQSHSNASYEKDDVQAVMKHAIVQINSEI